MGFLCVAPFEDLLCAVCMLSPCFRIRFPQMLRVLPPTSKDAHVHCEEVL